MMEDRYDISSNKESGEGRYDIQLMPRQKNMPGILIELKAAKNLSGEKLRQLSKEALEQIHTRKYDADMMRRGMKLVLKYGVAFSGKKVEISTDPQPGTQS